MFVTDRCNYEHSNTLDYLQITLTDENDIPDAMAKLRVIYPNALHLDYDNSRTREDREILVDSDFAMRSPLELFSHFYELQNNQPMDAHQKSLLETLVECIWEDNK